MTLRQRVDQVIGAAERRDFDALERAGAVDDEMEFHSVIARAEGTFHRGLDGLREWRAVVDDTWAGFRIEIVEVRPTAGDRALVRLRLTGTARASGVPLDVTSPQVWQWRDGRLWRAVAYSDHEEATRAADLG